MKRKVLTAFLLALAFASVCVWAGSRGGVGYPIRYSLYISGFAISDSADGEQSAISWNEVDVGRFLHVHVQANVPETVTQLQGRYAKLNADGEPGQEKDLGTGVKIRDGQYDFTLTHYFLESGSDYLLWVADDIENPRCVATHSVRTK